LISLVHGKFTFVSERSIITGKSKRINISRETPRAQICSRFSVARFYYGFLLSKINDLKQLAATGRTRVKKITKRHYRVAPFSSWGCRGTNQRLDP